MFGGGIGRRDKHGSLANREICWRTFPNSSADPEHSLSLLRRHATVLRKTYLCQCIHTKQMEVVLQTTGSFRQSRPYLWLCSQDMTAGGKMEFSRQPQPSSSVRTPNLKLSKPTSIFCNDRLSQQSSAALPSPVSFCFLYFSLKTSCFSVFSQFKPHLQTDKNHAPFSPYLLATIWVRLLNELHQLLSPMLGLPRIIIRWHFL